MQKAAIEAYLLDRGAPPRLPGDGAASRPYRRAGLGAAESAGALQSARSSRLLARGEELALPNLGMETVHHVHADDVAQIFMARAGQPQRAVGESFHVVSPAALTLRGYAEAVAGWFGQPARLRFLPWEEWRRDGRRGGGAARPGTTSPTAPTAASPRRSGCWATGPRYSSLQAVHESVGWLIDAGQLTAPGWGGA